MHSEHDAREIYHIMKHLRGMPVDLQHGDGYESIHSMLTDMPWEDIAKHFDGVYHGGLSGSGDYMMGGWDVESTAWLNKNVLELIGKVRIRPIDAYSDTD